METKRDFDPGVGGGTDRDKLPDADFAGPNRTYPIVTPKDVHDAAMLSGKHPEVKPKIIAIAKRKGPAFMAQLPDDWKNEKDLGPEYLQAAQAYSIRMQNKAWVNLAGSYEATQSLLNDAVDRWIDQAFPGQTCWNWVEATYPTKAIIGLGSTADGDFDGDGCAIEYWNVPYTVEDDATVTLGDPSAIDIRGVAVDRPDDDSDAISFLPSTNVVAKALAYKNASRLHRRYALLAWSGEDLSGVGLTRQDLEMTPEGLSNIPDAGSADFRTGQEDESQPGSTSDVPAHTNPPDWMSQPGHAGDQPNVPLPQWYQGTWFVDNVGNLVPASLGADVLNQPAGDQTSGPVPTSMYTGHHYGDLTSAPVTAVGTTMDAGTLTLAGTQRGDTKNATRIRKKARLLGLLKGQRYKFGASPIGEAGSKAGLSPEEANLVAALPEIQEKLAVFSVAVKEGRMLSAQNVNDMLAAHSKINDILTRSGVVSSMQEPINDEGGKDEEGVSVEPIEAKEGLPIDMVMQWQQMRKSVLTDPIASS